ncbi:hypothetical protein Fmac_010798 [Flemingia macrophylla]|uniref:MADS-box domain-containing protein n=1 Tax=Flemingia macrophylla TaxID=520843 RepID=A0ABD1MKL9_9FABA
MKKRRNTEIKEVKPKNRRYVTFTKRKQGLFHKLTELSLLCNVETALIITTPNGKLYSGGYSDFDAVLRRYLHGGPPPTCKKEQEEAIETLRVEYETIQNHLKEETKRLQEIVESKKSASSFGFGFGFGFGFDPWWNHSIEDMSLENVQEFKNSLESLRLNLVASAQEKPLVIDSVIPLMSCSMAAPMPFTILPPPF